VTDTARGTKWISDELVDYLLARQELQSSLISAMADYTFRRTDALMMGEKFDEQVPEEMIELAKDLWPMPEDDG